MPKDLGFCVIYRARVHPDKERLYVAAWSKLTSLLRSERGGLGSRLHRGADGIWYAYAKWPSAQARDEAFKLPSVDPAAEQDVRGSIVEYFPEIQLHPVEDQLVSVSGLAPNYSFKPNTLRYSKHGRKSLPCLLPLRVSA